MGLFDRIAFITRSKANALLDDLEDPVQAINQTIEDATKEYAQVIAGETRAKNTLREYEDKLAENAVLAGAQQVSRVLVSCLRQSGAHYYNPKDTSVDLDECISYRPEEDVYFTWKAQQQEYLQWCYRYKLGKR